MAVSGSETPINPCSSSRAASASSAASPPGRPINCRPSGNCPGRSSGTANDGRPTVTDTSQERLESAASTNPGPVAAAPEAPRINRTHSIANIPTIDPATVTPPAVDDQTSGGVDEEIAVTNKAALFYLDQGMALRNDGDMQGALVHFNSAASLEKDHPRILYEFAVTYEEMGLSEKAANFWKSIYHITQ